MSRDDAVSNYCPFDRKRVLEVEVKDAEVISPSLRVAGSPRAAILGHPSQRSGELSCIRGCSYGKVSRRGFGCHECHDARRIHSMVTMQRAISLG